MGKRFKNLYVYNCIYATFTRLVDTYAHVHKYMTIYESLSIEKGIDGWLSRI
jgi:hypothetical protein